MSDGAEGNEFVALKHPNTHAFSDAQARDYGLINLFELSHCYFSW